MELAKSHRSTWAEHMRDNDLVIRADNIQVLPHLPIGHFQLIYIDPPFNTGKTQRRSTIHAVRSQNEGQIGFQGRRYQRFSTNRKSYEDSFDDYLEFLFERLQVAKKLLTDSGTLYFHIDYREAHYCKILLDEIFGRDNFLNEIIWAYDYGGRAKDRWPTKHDTIFVYVKKLGQHYFNQDAIERIPYMAPGLVTKEKAERGKLPTDVWWHTIVPTNGGEKTGYPTQKPEGVLRRVLEPSSREGDWVLDFFAGSGTTGAVAQRLGRRFVMIDQNPEAVKTMVSRLSSGNLAVLDGEGCSIEEFESRTYQPGLIL